MRAISMWQPWASAVAFGSKTIETRHWATKYRGPLAIHAAKGGVSKGDLDYCDKQEPWHGALYQHLGDMFSGNSCRNLPRGQVIAVVNLVDCIPTNHHTIGAIDEPRFPSNPEHRQTGRYKWTERDLGDFSDYRFGWIFKDLRLLETPIPFKGHQGFFDVPDHLFPSSFLEELRYATVLPGLR